MGLHARLALAHRPEELTLFRAQYILRYSGDARKPSLQLRGPVKDKGVSRSSDNWAVSMTKAEPAGCVDKVSQQQGVLTMRSGHLCLPPYTAHSLPVWVPAASFWSLKPPLSGETVGIYVLCTVKGLERKTSIFFVFEVYTLSSPITRSFARAGNEFHHQNITQLCKRKRNIFPKRKLRCFCPRQFKIKRRTHWFFK